MTDSVDSYQTATASILIWGPLCFYTYINVRKRAKIRNRYNQVLQDSNGKVTTSQLDITNESQEVCPFLEGDHKASINRRVRQDINNINDPQKNHRLGTVRKIFYLRS